MERIRFIYFDIGGVMVDHFAALRTISRSINVPEEETLSLFALYANSLDDGSLDWATFDKIFYEKLQPEKRLDKPLVNAFVDNFSIIRETQELVADLSDKCDLGILTNNAQEIFRLVKSKRLIPDIGYKKVILSEDVHLLKPDIRIFMLAEVWAGTTPGEILFVDDKRENLEAATACGWKTFQFETANPAASVSSIRSMLKNIL